MVGAAGKARPVQSFSPGEWVQARKMLGRSLFHKMRDEEGFSLEQVLEFTNAFLAIVGGAIVTNGINGTDPGTTLEQVIGGKAYTVHRPTPAAVDKAPTKPIDWQSDSARLAAVMFTEMSAEGVSTDQMIEFNNELLGLVAEALSSSKPKSV